MNKEQLTETFAVIFPQASLDGGGEFITVTVPGGELLAFAHTLHTDVRLLFDHLFCLTCVDWKDHFMMVYHLASTKYRHELVVKVKLENRDEAVCDSLVPIWKGAEMLEREVYDMFGVRFRNHPNLKRLFLDENWKGFPLRKDYADEVNMIDY